MSEVLLDNTAFLQHIRRARRPFHAARLYAWLEDYFVIQQQEMEEDEDKEEDEGEAKGDDEEEMRKEMIKDAESVKKQLAKKEKEMEDSFEEMSQQDQQESRTVLDPADLKRLRQNVERDLGQVSLVAVHPCSPACTLPTWLDVHFLTACAFGTFASKIEI